MVTKSLENATLIPLLSTGSPHKTLGQFATITDVINVKNYGALGNGVADDTAAIQAAFDAAFGTSASPNYLSSNLNKGVYFPPGTYLVTPFATNKTITNVISDGAGGATTGHLTFTCAEVVTDLVVGKAIYVEGIDQDGYSNGTRHIASINTGNKTFTTTEMYYINSLGYTFSGSGIDVVANESYTNNGTTFVVYPSTVVGGTSVRMVRFNMTGNAPQTSGTLTRTGTVTYTFTVTAANATAGDTYTNNGVTYTVTSTIAGGLTLVTTATAGATTSGSTLTRSGTAQYTFTVSAANATAGATYTNNGITYTVSSTISGGLTLVTTAAAGATTSGTTLTKTSGTGDATITFSARATGDSTITFSARATADETISYTSFTTGGVGRTPCLSVTGVMGGLIFGMSKYGSFIQGVSPGSIVLATDGFYYSTIRDLAMGGPNGGHSTAGGKGLMLDMRGGLNSTVPFVGSQGNKVENCAFFEVEVGIEIGPTNTSQMSENMIDNCHFIWHTYCIRNGLNNNFNCLQQTINGGNCQAFTGAGIYVPYGSVPVVSGMGFQCGVGNSGAWDYLCVNSAGDTISMISCRSESYNVCYSNFQGICMVGGLHLGPGPGSLAYSQSTYDITSTYSLSGVINSWHGGCVRNSYFGQSGLNNSWVTNDTGSGAPVYVDRVLAGRTNIQAGADWWFAVSAANATAGATYTDGVYTFTVWQTITGGTQLKTTTNAFNAQPPVLSGGTLTKTSGTGDATISFSQADPTGQFYGRGIMANDSGTMKFVGDKVGQWRSYTVPDIIFTKSVFADLPAAASHWAGHTTFITDCNSSTRGATAAGGGANKVMVYCDGTNWIIM